MAKLACCLKLLRGESWRAIKGSEAGTIQGDGLHRRLRTSPYVDTKHHEACGGISVDTHQQEQGQEIRLITDTDGELGVKQFNLVGTFMILKERASRLSKSSRRDR